jgi:hypothetical protein
VTLALGIGLAAVPCLSLFAAWRICGPDRRDLLIWPVLGITLAALPGLVFVISEAFLAVCLGWPIVMAAALGRIGAHRLLVSVLVVGLAVTHPFAVLMLGSAAIAAAAVVAARRHAPGSSAGRAEVGAILVLAGLTAAVALRYLVLPSPYEADTLSLDRLGDHLRGGVAGRPLLAVLLTWALGAWLLVRPGGDRRGLAGVSALVAALLVVLVPWGLDVGRWERALMFRTFLFAVEVPLMMMLIISAVRRPSADQNTHGFAIAGAGTVAVAVLLAQSIAWREARHELIATLETRLPGCVEFDSLGLPPSALDHWGVTALVYLEQAPAPRHLVVVDASCAALDVVGGVPFKIVGGVLIERIPVDGAFDLRAIEEAMRDRSP